MPSPHAQPHSRLIDRFSLTDALDEGAPTGSLPYLEMVSAAVEDGQLVEGEVAALRGLADAAGWTSADVQRAHEAFIQALAYEALHDGRVSRQERAELLQLSELLGVSASVVRRLLDRAERARHARLSAGLAPLPPGWQHGEPLRVGDKVVFTGCETHDRESLERRAENLGVRVLGTVSSKVAMLISDGTVNGTKAARARELNTRVVHPRDFIVLLAHLQPAHEIAPPARAVASGADGAMPAPAPPRQPTPKRDTSAIDPRAVREWARAQGLQVADRGRLPTTVTQAYLQAHAPIDEAT